MDRIEVTSLNMVANSSFKDFPEDCVLCRSKLMFPPPNDLANGDFYKPLVKGVCGHVFHKSCINAHCANDNVSCPVDKTPWNVASEHKTLDFVNKK